MTRDRRNPWIILGIDYGSPAAEASRAFALGSRRLRRSGAGEFGVDDLTWALNEVEAPDHPPELDVSHFRVPADPSAYVDPAMPPDAEGLLRPRRPPAPRANPPLSPQERDEITGVAAGALISRLLELPTIDTCPYRTTG